MNDPRPLICLLVPLLAVIGIANSAKRPNLREGITFVAAGINLALVLSMLPIVLGGETVNFTFVSEILPGVDLGLRIDALGMIFALVASTLWIVTTIFAIGYMRGLAEHAQSRFFAYFAVAIAMTLGVAFSGNLLTLYVFYELLSLSTYPLVTHHQDGEARGGGRKYLTYLMATSIGLALPALVIVYSYTGNLDFAAGGMVAGKVPDAGITPLLCMLVFGFAKAGIMPFHAWLPGAMVAPTPVSALLHAVAVVKVGVFCVLRVFTGVFGMTLPSLANAAPIIATVASVTIIVASLIAMSQDNLKRLLAYSTIGQLSYIVLGAALLTPLGLTGSFLHIAMHAFGKITLFFVAGSIFVGTGCKYISQIHGLGRKQPILMGAFAIGALSVIGLPPAGGFLSKWYLVRGTLDGGNTIFMAVFLVSSFLNAVYFLPIIYNSFFREPSEELKVPGAESATWWCCWLAPAVTATISLVLLFWQGPFLKLAELAVSQFFPQ
ncbi:MAG: multicomponent Na+:H+ antiporter subunit D [Rhodothermales bacterium]|jgi:multicomponent Na+:H+ antiporter subunit D